MQHCIPVACVAIILGLGLSACESSDDTTYLGDSDNGRTVTLNIGNELEIALSGNPTTGYTWQLVAVNAQILAQDRDPVYYANSDATGAGGSYVFHFKAMGSGQTTLTLANRRSWNGESAQTFQVAIIVP